MKRLLGILILSGLLLGIMPAAASQWQLDPDHSEIRFKVKHILTSVSGQFSGFKGDILFDPKHPEDGKFNFTVDVKSVNTHHGKRDNHLRSKDFFNADAYPEMRFISSRISHVKDNVYSLEGMMTIKDVTQNVKVMFRFLGPQPHPFMKDKHVAGFVTQFPVQRLDYHVGNGKFLKMGVVGNLVDVEIALEALTKK